MATMIHCSVLHIASHRATRRVISPSIARVVRTVLLLYIHGIFFFIHFYSAPMLLLSLSIEFGFFFYCVLQASHKDVGTKAKCNNRNVLSDSEENLIFTLNKSVDSKKRKQKFAANMFVCLYNAQTV